MISGCDGNGSYCIEKTSNKKSNPTPVKVEKIQWSHGEKSTMHNKYKSYTRPIKLRDFFHAESICLISLDPKEKACPEEKIENK